MRIHRRSVMSTLSEDWGTIDQWCLHWVKTGEPSISDVYIEWGTIDQWCLHWVGNHQSVMSTLSGEPSISDVYIECGTIDQWCLHWVKTGGTIDQWCLHWVKTGEPSISACHDITEILLKLALNTNQSVIYNCSQCW